MKILHISNYYHPDIGGIETTARDCVNSLLGEENVAQRVFCFSHGRKNRMEEVDGVPVVRAGSILKISSQSLSLSYYKLLKREISSFSPDVVIFHFPNPFGAHYLLKLLKKRKNIKLILWWHLDITKQKILGKFFRGQTRRLMERAEKIVATSPNYILGSKFLYANRQKCTVICSCVSPEAVKADEGVLKKAEEIRRENKNKTILFALGRHIPYKGLSFLVQASKLLDESFAVFIGGEGPLTKSLKKLARGDEKVRFLGKIGDDEKNAYLCACDIFCFPSITKNEAFGLALAEAMTFAKPAVTFHIEGSGVNFVSLNGVTGLEVDNQNVEKYAAAILKLAKDDALRLSLGKAARERVQENFTFEIFSKKVRELLFQVAGA